MSHYLQKKPYTAWQLIKAYWQSDQRVSAYVFLIAVLIMTISLVLLQVVLNYWYSSFYDALQDYDKSSVLALLKVFAFIAAVLIVLSVYRYYLQSFLALRWRRWLTMQFIERWLEKKSYYYLENFDERTDNPDQRIQEDINALVTSTLSLVMDFLTSTTTLFGFMYVLWTLSGVIDIPLGSWGTLHVPGYLAWIGVIYAIVGTWATFKIGYPLVDLNFMQQRREADFRFAAVDLRTHAEHVALYHGEVHQKNVLDAFLDKALNNAYMIILRQKLVLWFVAGYNQASVLLPFLVALPNYFNKVFELGGLMQTTRAFAQVQESLSFFINSYMQIAEWRAVVRRLLTFLNHMQEIEHQAEEADHFAFHENNENKINVKNLDILTPQNKMLLQNINEEFISGNHTLIKGPSGIGKSTFIRVIAKIWPYGSGEVGLPAGKNIMYVPQKSYMPIGTLEDALIFPSNAHLVPVEMLAEYLSICGLAGFASRLQDISMWSQQLSPGEQQRIGFVRLLIQKPDWVFLDESTSSLDIASEKKLYEVLKTYLPACTVVSVGHRPSLEGYHSQLIDFTKYIPVAAIA